ncbi:MAG: ABC transporter ATP-binding protein [Firmicutes bacterium]|nr:ABC transporter ATP-binding protein [Bacillota bacterium]MBQ2084454.1 ABC transporter ATP-binding protein [Bacillota bacterium]MBQ2217618.1 ABC transporter ATP-binding protein [Bacillota bacterium]
MQPLLKAENITKTYKTGDVDVQALKGVSFTIEDGELIVVLGPSGSGKSTMLNILGGIETATSGNIFYEGEPLDWSDRNALSDYRRAHIGFVFQFYNLLPGLTALENIELSGELSQAPLDAKKLIGEVGLADRADHYPSRLSGGEQQRIAIARALCKNPDILLCDEPTGALDSKTGIQVLKLLWDFCREYHKTVVLITHNQSIAGIADRVIYVRDGLIEKIEANPDPRDPEEVVW